MKKYTKLKTVKLTESQYNKLIYLKSKKINISKLIRTAIDKELLLHVDVPKDKKDYRLLLKNSFPI